MQRIERNSYGELQLTNRGYRIVREGDNLVAYTGTLKQMRPLFERLGKLTHSNSFWKHTNCGDK